MKRRLYAAIGAVCLFLPACARSAAEEKETIRKTFQMDASGPKRLEVDNVFGSIRVTGHAGREVEVTAHQTIRADTDEARRRAREEVKLDMTQQGNTVRLYVDGPFRDSRGRRDSPRYTVAYDFEIRTPRDASVWLRTINDGDIRVSGIAGDYDVKNINGGIEMMEAAGSGAVYALNGRVRVVFRENPKADSRFGSLNGAVDLYFQPGLSADLRMKTFNGDIFSDFPVTMMPRGASTAERSGGRVKYRADRFSSARVGGGGPEIELDGFNGDIRILNQAVSRPE